jgi:hypothetical protein
MAPVRVRAFVGEVVIDMPPALPDGYVCPDGTVPGWLNGDGLPTACVGDAAIPGEVFPPALPLNPLPDVLAATGGEWLLIAAIAASLVAIGFAFLAAAAIARRPRYKRK